MYNVVQRPQVSIIDNHLQYNSYERSFPQLTLYLYLVYIFLIRAQTCKPLNLKTVCC